MNRITLCIEWGPAQRNPCVVYFLGAPFLHSSFLSSVAAFWIKPFVYNLLWNSSSYCLRVGAGGLFLTPRASSQLSSGIYRTGSCFCLIFTASHYQKHTLGWFCGHLAPHTAVRRWRRHLPVAQKHSWVTMTCTVAKGDKSNSLCVVRLFSVLKEKELWMLKAQDRGAEDCPECFETSHWYFTFLKSSDAEVCVNLKSSGCCALAL